MKATTGQVVSACGAAATAVGYILVLSNLNQSIDLGRIVEIIGVGVFFAGLVLELNDVRNKINALHSQHKALTTKLAIASGHLWDSRDPKAIYLRATSEVLDYMVTKYIPSMADNFQKFTDEQAVLMEVADHSPIFDLMYRLGHSLPEGSAWLGITLLSADTAWTSPLDDRFLHFRDLMRDRARSNSLEVFRLYYVPNEAALERLKPQIRNEIKNKLRVKYLLGGSPPPDVSVLWSPRAGSGRNVASFRTDLGNVDFIDEERFEGLCALAYDTRAGAHLTRIEIHPASSPNFANLDAQFREYWNKGVDFKVDV